MGGSTGIVVEGVRADNATGEAALASGQSGVGQVSRKPGAAG